MADIEVAGLVTRLSIDDTDLERSMAELNRSMKLVQSEFKKSSSGLEDFGKGADGLKLKSESLTKQLDIQGIRVAKLNEQYQKSVEEKGKDAVATQKLETQLNNAVASYNKLESELKQTNQELATQTSQWTKLGTSLETASKKLQATGQAMTNAGKSLTATVTAPLVATGGLALKTAIDFESAFAGVRKTVDATEAEFAVLSSGIREMSRNMPQAATEIAGVAEAAGQLGIKNEAILGFTKTMVNMGVATNLSSEEAAMSLARLATITGMNQQEFDRLGSTIVYLGNNLAATEAEITEMGLRIAGAGNIVGMSEHQILAFAGSLSAVGINAEAGGTAFSKLMVNIANEVATGGKKLESFAAVAGMSAEQFQKSFKDDAASAIVSFIEGLGGIEKAGGNVFGVLEALGLTEVRLRDAILRSAGAGDVMRNSLEMGAKAWAENNALTNEAEQRYQTAASQLQIFKNRLADVGITLGNALIPALLKTLDAMQPLINMLARGAEWFANLPKGVQTTAIAFAGLAASMGPVLLISGSLITSIGTIVGALGKLTTALGAAGGAAAVFSRGLLALTGPIGATIAAITALIAAGVALYKYFSKDAVVSVQRFGDASQASLDRASGSFKKFRGEADSSLKDTAQVADSRAKEIGDAIASGVGKGTKKAKDKAVSDIREMVDKMKQEVDRNRDALNRLGDGLVAALKKSYEESEKAQIKALDDRIDNEKKASDSILKQYEREQEKKTKALDRQLNDEKKASDARLKIYDREYAEKLKLIDEETYRQVKALQDEIDAIDKQTEAEERAKKEQEYRDRIEEYNRQLALAETAEERKKIQDDINKTVAEYERQQLLDSRKVQKDALKEQIDAVKEAATERKNQLKQELDDQKEAEKERLSTLQESLKEQKTEVKAHYDDLKESEKERLKSLQESLNEEKTSVKEHYAELTEQENLFAEARKLINEKNNDEIIRLLESYNPKWQDAGQSFADSFAKGLASEKQTIEQAVGGIANIAPAISSQISELDRLQAKLKDLESAAKGAGGEAGFSGGGIQSIADSFEDATYQATDFASTLESNVQPAMNDFGNATAEMSEQAVDAFIGLRDKATLELNQLYWSGKEVTEEAAEVIADTFFAMGIEIEEGLKESHARRLSEMQEFFASSESLTQEEKDKAIATLVEQMEQEANEVQNGQNRIAEILKQALDEQRALTQEEYSEINRIQQEMTKEGIRILSGSAEQHKIILEKMKQEAANVTAQQASEVAKNSIKQRNETIAAAEEQYDLAIAQIIKLRDEAGVISEEQADKLIDEARRQRDETVAAAEDMHKRVVEHAQNQAWEHADKVNWETGEILSKWQVFSNNLSRSWDEMTSDAKRKLDNQMQSVRLKYHEMKLAISGKMSEIKQSISSHWSNVELFFKSINLKKTGEDIMQGLADGMGNMAQSVWDKAKSIAVGIGDSITQTMGIRSPSRVTMAMGMNIGEGLAIGMQGTIDEIERKAKLMAAAATPAIKMVAGAAITGNHVSAAPSVGDALNTYNFERMFEGANITIREDRDIMEMARALADIIISERR